jgi:hypothetical protein
MKSPHVPRERFDCGVGVIAAGPSAELWVLEVAGLLLFLLLLDPAGLAALAPPVAADAADLDGEGYAVATVEFNWW